MDNMKHRRLQELDRSDFEVVDGQPDIRGWDVKTPSGKMIGDVEELILDAKNKKVRYMVVDLDDNDLDLDDRKVLIPIGLAELDKDDDNVILPSVNASQLRNLPSYDKDHLDENTERTICSAFGRTGAEASRSGSAEPEFYAHDYFNDDNLYRHRLAHNAGNQRDSDYERGLRLWERRSEGGIMDSGERRMSSNRTDSDDSYHERTIDENTRMEMIRNRRNNYQQRRNSGQRTSDNYNNRNRSVEDRIKEEGLRDPDEM
jgi:hypothetical protein